MRLIRGCVSTAIFAKIADEPGYPSPCRRQPRTRSILQFRPRPDTECKGFRRLILRRKVASVATLSILSASAAYPKSVPPEKYDCSDTEVTRQVVGEKDFTSDKQPMPLMGSYIFFVNRFEYPRNQTLVIRWDNKTQVLTLNGKQCKRVAP